MIKLLDNQYRKQKRMATLAAKEHEPALLEKVNTARARAIRLLEKDASITKRQLDTLKQRMVLETSPRVGYAKRLELKYARDLDRTYRELMIKRKKGIITDHERIRLARTMDKLMKRQGWESKNRLRIQKQLTAETQKQVKVEEKRKRSRFPGGGLLSPGRMGWFVQLRAFWGMYQVVQQTLTEMVELDEAVGRSMRTMRSETLSYGEVAERVHNTVLDVARKTGATYRNVGEALYQLSSAGLTAEEALSAVNSVIMLTQTTEAEVTDATKVIAGVFNNFGDALGNLTNDTEAFNLISATLSYVWERNQVDMNEMVQALNQAAQAADLAGVTFTELSVVIGNLGTMMIRSGRAGRSIRTAIIQMAAKGEELAATFGFEYDETAPLDFMHTMDQMAEKWKDMTQTALVAEKITSIFGRRGAPAILALLKNWEKVRKEIEETGDTLELLTNQHEKLLRLQERYKLVSSTVWKELMNIVIEFADPVAYLGEKMHELLLYFKDIRAFKEHEEGLLRLTHRYQDAGAMTNRLAEAQAELRMAVAALKKEEGDHITLRRRFARWFAQSRLNIMRDAAEGRDLSYGQQAIISNRIKLLKELIIELDNAARLTKLSEIIDKRRAGRELDAAKSMYTRKQALEALNRQLRLHGGLSGDLVFTERANRRNKKAV
jgi:TP901 family phage tail tape measure protein